MIRAALLALVAAGASAPTDPLAGRVAGPVADCIDLDRVQAPEPQRGGAILYRQSGARVWRMTLLERCGALTPDTRIVAEVTGRRFCRGDRFQLFRPDAPAPVGYCRAGAFVPFDRATR